ncbi:MAG: hypothetical protein JST52_04305 [Bacteroidetes bacterium]|nr:hypothetical protein [Bacteroidota bacterium]MBS1741092.1 hypothetical protein [Bacteroidota bacterium]
MFSTGVFLFNSCKFAENSVAMIAILNKEEKDILQLLRSMPAKARKSLMAKLEEIREDMEDEKDIKDIKKREQEATIPAEEVFAKLGF